MEFLFSDTVTRLSTRVVQLENKQKNTEKAINKQLDDCGGALDFDSYSADGRIPGKGAQILPGGRIKNNLSGAETPNASGLKFSASTESILGGKNSSSKRNL